MFACFCVCMCVCVCVCVCLPVCVHIHMSIHFVVIAEYEMLSLIDPVLPTLISCSCVHSCARSLSSTRPMFLSAVSDRHRLGPVMAGFWFSSGPVLAHTQLLSGV